VIGKSEGKAPLGSHRRVWEDNFKMDRKKVAWEDVDWINRAKDRNCCRAVANTVRSLGFQNTLRIS
jgi:hypothetical protein